MKGLTLWLCKETSLRCTCPTAFINGIVLENYLTCYLPPNFLSPQYVTNINMIQNIWIRGTQLLCGFVGTSFLSTRNCGMVYLRQCIRVDTTWVPSKSASVSTPSVLHGIVCGGVQLLSGHPYVRLVFLFPQNISPGLLFEPTTIGLLLINYFAIAIILRIILASRFIPCIAEKVNGT